MQLPTRPVAALARLLFSRIADRRWPDLVIGADSPEGPYLLRWYVTPWRRWRRDDGTRWQRALGWACRWLPNVYLHMFLRDDDDRALHDHPSWGVSLILQGHYIEHTIAAGGIHHRREYHAGALRFLPTRHTHRIELPRDAGPVPSPCWTLFMFGPVVREWGFHCPERGWVPWEEFTAPGAPGEIGRGCGDG